MKSRKRPCSVCRRWFTPSSRGGARQRTCGKPECRQRNEQRRQRRWRDRNPDYDVEIRLRTRLERLQKEGAASVDVPASGHISRPGLPAALRSFPWDFAVEAVGPQGALLVVFALTLVRSWLAAASAQSTLPPPQARSGSGTERDVSPSEHDPSAQTAIIPQHIEIDDDSATLPPPPTSHVVPQTVIISDQADITEDFDTLSSEAAQTVISPYLAENKSDFDTLSKLVDNPQMTPAPHRCHAPAEPRRVDPTRQSSAPFQESRDGPS